MGEDPEGVVRGRDLQRWPNADPGMQTRGCRHLPPQYPCSLLYLQALSRFRVWGSPCGVLALLSQHQVVILCEEGYIHDLKGMSLTQP